MNTEKFKKNLPAIILNTLMVLAIAFVVWIVMYAPVPKKQTPKISPAQVCAILDAVQDALTNYDDNWNLITNK